MQFHKEAFTNYLHRFLSFFHWEEKLLKFPIQNTEVQKIHISYIWSNVQPKPGFGIMNQNQGPIWVSVSMEVSMFSIEASMQYQSQNFSFRNRNFFCQKNSKKFKFVSCFPTCWGDIDFYKLEKKSRNISYLATNLVLGVIWWWKKLLTGFSPEIWFRYRLQYWPKIIDRYGFRYRT